MQHEIYNNRQWTRQTMRLYGIFILLSFGAECIGQTVTWFLNRESFWNDLLFYTARPTLAASLLYLCAAVLIRKYPAHSPYFVTTSGSLIAAVLIVIFPETTGVPMLPSLNILVAAFFFAKRFVTYALAVNTILLGCVYAVSEPLRSHTDPYSLILYAVLLFACFALAQGILSRGHELLNALLVAERNSKIDALTQLYNHITFQERLNTIFQYLGSDGRPFCLALLDIDNFKSINDTYGHYTGDIVLRRVAGVIRESIGPDDFAARYGGEEFALLLINRPLEGAYALCERLRENIASLRIAELGERSVTVSIGLRPHLPGNGKDLLFKEADACLYHAKRTGKNRICTSPQSPEIAKTGSSC